MNLEYSPAEVDETKLDKIKKLEASTGTVIVALEPAARFARLTREQLDELQNTERELGVVMVAYEAH